MTEPEHDVFRREGHMLSSTWKHYQESVQEDDDDIYNRWYTRITTTAPFAFLWILAVLMTAIFGHVFPPEYTHFGKGMTQDEYETNYGSIRSGLVEACTLYQVQLQIQQQHPDFVFDTASASACIQLDEIRSRPPENDITVVFLGLYIDSNTKYIGIMTFAFVSSFISTFLYALPITYLTNEIQDTSGKDIPYSYMSIQVCGVFLQVYIVLSQILEMQASFVQLDIALAVVGGSVCSRIWTIHMFMQKQAKNRQIQQEQRAAKMMRLKEREVALLEEIAHRPRDDRERPSSSPYHHHRAHPNHDPLASESYEGSVRESEPISPYPSSHQRGLVLEKGHEPLETNPPKSTRRMRRAPGQYRV